MEEFALAHQKLQDLLQPAVDFARQFLQLSVCWAKNQSLSWGLPLTLRDFNFRPPRKEYTFLSSSETFPAPRHCPA